MNYDFTASDFIHPELGVEITAIGGHYVFTKEIRLPHRGREILYYVGYAVLDTTGGSAYVLVAGYIKKWKYKTDHNNAPLSEVEPIRDEIVQKELRRLIQNREKVFQVSFN